MKSIAAPCAVLALFASAAVAEEQPSQVEIDVSFVAFEMPMIEEVARKSDRAAPSGDELKALWREGKGRLLATGKTVTRSGVNAQVKGVEEVRYPTEFLPPDGTNAVTNPTGLVPTSFETRETGLIVNVTPTVGEDGRTIDLTLVPELCEAGEPDQIGVTIVDPGNKTRELQVRQPRFHSRNVTTSVVLHDGQTVVCGGLPNRDGAESSYLFISAQVLDADGAPIRAAAPRKAKTGAPAPDEPKKK